MGLEHNTLTIKHPDGTPDETLPGLRFRAARAEGGLGYVVIDTHAPRTAASPHGAPVWYTASAPSMYAEAALRELKAAAHAKADQLNGDDPTAVRLRELKAAGDAAVAGEG
jgi:hypothetical protein